MKGHLESVLFLAACVVVSTVAASSEDQRALDEAELNDDLRAIALNHNLSLEERSGQLAKHPQEAFLVLHALLDEQLLPAKFLPLLLEIGGDKATEALALYLQQQHRDFFRNSSAHTMEVIEALAGQKGPDVEAVLVDIVNNRHLDEPRTIFVRIAAAGALAQVGSDESAGLGADYVYLVYQWHKKHASNYEMDVPWTLPVAMARASWDERLTGPALRYLFPTVEKVPESVLEALTEVLAAGRLTSEQEHIFFGKICEAMEAHITEDPYTGTAFCLAATRLTTAHADTVTADTLQSVVQNLRRLQDVQDALIQHMLKRGYKQTDQNRAKATRETIQQLICDLEEMINSLDDR